MKKIILALTLVSSMAVLSGCGFNTGGCCPQPTCATPCATNTYTTYTYSGYCGMSDCYRSWY